MDAKPAPTKFIPTFTLLIGGAVLMGGVFIMIDDSGSTAPGLILAAIGSALEACGMLSLVYPVFRKHIMHVAILAALFGMGNVFSCRRRLARSGRRPRWSPPVVPCCARCCLPCT